MVPGMYAFQSLLHQGISLLKFEAPTFDTLHFLFQSLLHQGISLLDSIELAKKFTRKYVSIPSSSGHQFTGLEMGHIRETALKRFNPFFIRASVY